MVSPAHSLEHQGTPSTSFSSPVRYAPAANAAVVPEEEREGGAHGFVLGADRSLDTSPAPEPDTPAAAFSPSTTGPKGSHGRSQGKQQRRSFTGSTDSLLSASLTRSLGVELRAIISPGGGQGGERSPLGSDSGRAHGSGKAP